MHVTGSGRQIATAAPGVVNVALPRCAWLVSMPAGSQQLQGEQLIAHGARSHGHGLLCAAPSYAQALLHSEPAVKPAPRIALRPNRCPSSTAVERVLCNNTMMVSR